MLAKYHIEYAMHLGRNAHVNHYQTDDPVAAEEFLVHLLEHGSRFHALRHEGVDLLVATPGRLLDLHGRQSVSFEDIEVLVLDEADRMVDMGFAPDLRRILRLLPERSQHMAEVQDDDGDDEPQHTGEDHADRSRGLDVRIGILR